jgi:hypothetical protein
VVVAVVVVGTGLCGYSVLINTTRYELVLVWLRQTKSHVDQGSETTVTANGYICV